VSWRKPTSSTLNISLREFVMSGAEIVVFRAGQARGLIAARGFLDLLWRRGTRIIACCFSDDEIAVFRAWLLPPPEPSASAADDATADMSGGGGVP
jgi:hypothetical protein